MSHHAMRAPDAHRSQSGSVLCMLILAAALVWGLVSS